MNAIPDLNRPGSTSLGPTFLHPTDFGPTGRLALAHAVALSLKAHARLTLLHVRGLNEAGPTRNGLGPVADLLVKWGWLTDGERFADLKSKLGFSASCLDVPARSVAEGLLTHIEHQLVELIVLTTHARSGLRYWLAGSASRQLLRSSNTLVLFLREGQRGFIDLETGELGLKRVLIPIDGSVEAAAAVARARKLIDGLAESVEKRLLHIGASPPAYAPKDIPLTLAQGPVAETILAEAKTFGADLIVMPTAGKRGMFGAFRDSVSAKILDDARWPVLSVPVL